MGYQWHATADKPEVMTTITGFSSQYMASITALVNFVNSFVVCISILVPLFVVDSLTMLYIIVFFLTYYSAILVLISKKIRANSNQIGRLQERVFENAINSLDLIRDLKINQLEPVWINKQLECETSAK